MALATAAVATEAEPLSHERAEIVELPELRSLLRGAGKTDPDDAPAPPVDPVSELGDLWLLGPHRLLCGDATKADDVARVMAGDKAALFATDPPYLVDYTGDDRPNNSGKDWSAVYREVDMKDAPAFFRAVFTNAAAHVVEAAPWYCWHAHKRVALLEQTWAELGVLNHQQIVWVKPVALHGHAFWPWQHEPCLFGWRKGHRPAHDGNNSHEQTSVWAVGYDGARAGEHPTIKPVELFARPMRKHTQPGDVCYEPFSGSGSQIIAGEKEGRRVFALEISPPFVDVAVRRWEAYTGQAATLEGDGRTFADIAAARGKVAA